MDKYDEEFANKIAKACIKKFDNLGKNGKPKDGECAFLACILKEERPLFGPSYNIEVVALGTGSKCIGESQQTIEGNTLKDSHAEVIARRAFKIYLLNQVELTINGKDSILEIGIDGFRLKESVSFHYYSSHTPCGDASILPKVPSIGHSDSILKLKTDISDEVDVISVPKKRKLSESYSDIHRTGAKCAPGETSDSKVAGINYHAVGSLRVKPGRGEPTLSHSCSDKIFKWTILGIQGALLMLFLSKPIYLSTVTFGSCLYNDVAIRRALFSRFEEKLQKLKLFHGYKIVTPKFLSSDISFKYWRTEICSDPCYSTIIWSKSVIHKNKHEVSIEGKRLGSTKKTANSLTSQVSICRNKLFCKVILLIKVADSNLKKMKEIIAMDLNVPKPITIETFKALNNFVGTVSVLENVTYREIKEAAVNYQLTWKSLKDEVLINWTKKNENFKCFKAKFKD